MSKMEASFSVLAMSLASSTAMALGLAPDPQSGQTIKDKAMAQFNIDLLLMLEKKTMGNLTTDEDQFLKAVINDLQLKFIETK